MSAAKLPPSINEIKFDKESVVNIRQDSFLQSIGIKRRVELQKLTHLTPVLPVKFGCKKTEYQGVVKDGSFDIGLELEEDYSSFYTEGRLKEFIINYCKKNSNKLDCSDDEELLDEFYKSKVYKKEPYAPILNATIREDKWYKISFKKFLFDKDKNLLSNPNFEELLKRGTSVQIIIDIPYFDICETQIRPCIKVQMIQILEESKPYIKNYLNLEDTDLSKLIIGNKETNDNGGSFSYIRYDYEKYNGKFYFNLENVKLAPFSFESTDDKSGAVRYSVSPKIENEEHSKFFTNLYDSILEQLTVKSKDLFGKKKNKKLLKATFTNILKYSKSDKELIKNGEQPKYNPTISVSTNKYDGKFSFDFVDAKGEKMEEFFGDYKLSNPDTSFNVKFSIKHIWYGIKGYSIKFILEEIQIAEEKQTSFAFSFDNDENSENAEGSPDEAEASGEDETKEVGSNNEDEDEEPENSSDEDDSD